MFLIQYQLHCELVASVKLMTELTTLAASLVTVAICAAEGLDDRPATELFSASTDEVMALVWLGKSLLAELTSAVASLWIVATCDFKPLTPLLTFKLVSPLMEFSRLVRSRAVTRLAATAARERDYTGRDDEGQENPGPGAALTDS